MIYLLVFLYNLETKKREGYWTSHKDAAPRVWKDKYPECVYTGWGY